MKKLQHIFEIGSANIKFQFYDEDIFLMDFIKISCGNCYYRRIEKKNFRKLTYKKNYEHFWNIFFPWDSGVLYMN